MLIKYKYIITEGNAFLSFNGKNYTLAKDSEQFDEAVEALRNGNFELAADLMKPLQAVQRKISENKNLQIENGVLFWKGKQLNNYIGKKILALVKQNRKIDLLVSFLDKLMQNPLERVQDELLQFLEYGKLPICTDGDFLAYKKVDSDFYDLHSHTCDYSPRKVVKMKRELCDTDSKNVCSSGLHFCSFEYLKYYGGDNSKVIIVKINPKDVTSIPADYNNTKGRACKITSVCEYTEKTDVDKLKTMDFVNVKSKGKQAPKTVKPICKGKNKVVREYSYEAKNWRNKDVNSAICPFCGGVVIGSTSTFESGHGKVCSCGARLSRRKATKIK